MKYTLSLMLFNCSPLSQAWNFYNWPEGRETPQPSGNGFGTARAVAKLYGILANGGSDDGKVLLRKPALEKLFTPLRSGRDVVLAKNITWGYGVQHHLDEGYKVGKMMDHEEPCKTSEGYKEYQIMDHEIQCIT